MMNLRIMTWAVRIRLRRGEDLEAILNSYPKLTASDKATIRKAVLS